VCGAGALAVVGEHFRQRRRALVLILLVHGVVLLLGMRRVQARGRGRGGLVLPRRLHACHVPQRRERRHLRPKRLHLGHLGFRVSWFGFKGEGVGLRV
jgi:hypothetical protein